MLPQAKLDNLRKNKHAFDGFEKQGADLSKMAKMEVPKQPNW